jgi:hypothetical protein
VFVSAGGGTITVRTVQEINIVHDDGVYIYYSVLILTVST